MGLSCLVVEREPAGKKVVGGKCTRKGVRKMWLEEEVVQAVLAVVVLCSSTLVAHAHLWTQQQFDQVLIDVQSIQFTTDVEVSRYKAEGGGVDVRVEAVQIKFDVGAGLPEEFVERAQLNGVNGGGAGHGERGGSVWDEKRKGLGCGRRRGQDTTVGEEEERQE